MGNKSILMSIQPKWVAKILNGEKTIEVRKRFPKDYIGWVYIYCTKVQGRNGETQIVRNIKTKKYCLWKDLESYNANDIRSGYNGLVLARFWCDSVEKLCGKMFDDRLCIVSKTMVEADICEKACLEFWELQKYLEHKEKKLGGVYHSGYAIHITNVEMFDKPKELKDFYFQENCANCPHKKYCKASNICKHDLQKAPQSWCYVEVS